MPVILVTSTTTTSGNVELAYAQITTNATTTQPQPTAATIITAPSITFDGTTRVLVEFFAPAVGHSVDQGQVLFDLWEDATDRAIIGEFRADAASAASTGIVARMFYTPTAGGKVLSIRAWVPAGTGTINAGTGTGGALAPAYLRVTTAPLLG